MSEETNLGVFVATVWAGLRGLVAGVWVYVFGVAGTPIPELVGQLPVVRLSITGVQLGVAFSLAIVAVGLFRRDGWSRRTAIVLFGISGVATAAEVAIGGTAAGMALVALDALAAVALLGAKDPFRTGRPTAIETPDDDESATRFGANYR